MSDHSDLANALDEIALHFKVEDRGHLANQYRKASDSILRANSIPPDPSELHNVGDSIRDDIIEYQTTGEINTLEEMRDERPYLSELIKVDGLGPKTAQKIYRETGAETVDELKDVIKSGNITNVSGIGEKTAKNFKRSLYC